MLIIYQLTDGKILENTGTNSLYPLGIPFDDTEAWRVNLKSRGITLNSCGFLRLHDIDDAAIISRIFNELYHVDITNGSLVFDGPIPPPVIQPTLPTIEEQFAALTTMLIAKGTITKAEIDEIIKPKIK